jgi:hypothetical protein
LEEDVDGDDEEPAPLMEIEFELGNLHKIKDTTGKLIVHFIERIKTTKDSINMSYDEIRFKTQRKKDKEKKQITDAFEKMERDERKVEDMLKQFKIGRWNIGMQKSLFKYKHDTYARQQTLNKYLNEGDMDPNVAEEQEGGIEFEMGDDIQETEAEIEDLERVQAAEIEEEYEAEANDIAGLDEDYTDGRYYEEDMGEDF